LAGARSRCPSWLSGSRSDLMTPNYVSLRAVDDPAGPRLRRTHGRDSEALNVIYVVDERASSLTTFRSRRFC
jgi:hypothetical protein